MKKTVQFYLDLLNKNINLDGIMFTDECRVSLNFYTNNLISLEPDIKK